MTATSLPRVPEGLRDLMKVYTKEVLREKPSDLYGFSANFFNLIVGDKSHQPVRKFEPVQTYETIMKNRIRQQVPISMVFNMIPETLTDLIKQFIKAVLREKPENIYIFAQEYFQRLSKEKSGRVEYTKYATYEKSLKDKENVAPVSKVTCECGRILSANTKGVDSSVTLSNTSTSDINQKNTLGNVNYLKSVLIIQRQIRRYLKRKKISRKKDKCNSLEYMTSILLIQRQVRRYLAKRRLEKLKVLRSQQPKAKLDTANYMKAVIVIQRHYRIYLKKKQEQNRLKSGTVSLATAAIIIQKAFRRMVARNRAKRNASASTDQAEELNDNGSETGSYTSVSTALLSTESTELGGLNYEERVHQKIIHEDEEVENNNVDAGLEKEYFAKAITGGEKSMHLRKRDIVEDMLSKSNNDSTESEVEVKKQPETEIEDEFTANKTKNDIKLENDSELKANTDAQLEKEDNLEATKAMDDSKSEKIPIIETSKPIEEKELKNAGDLDLKSEKEAVVKSERAVDDPVSEEASKIIINQVVTKDDVTEDSTAKEKEDSSAESGNGKNAEISSSINNEEVNVSEKKNDDLEEPISKKIEDSPDESGKDEKDQIPSNEVIPLPKIINSDSQLEKVPTLSLVTPTISIEHVENLPQEEEEQILTPSNINAESLKDSTDDKTLPEQTESDKAVEIESLKTVLANHNKETLEQDSTKDALSEKELIESTDPATPTSSQDEVVISKNNSLEKNPSDSEVSPSTEEVKTPETDSSEKITKAAEVSTLSREKRSLEEPETDLDKSNEKSMTEDLAKQESIKKDDDTEDIPLTNLNQLSQEEIQEGNEEKSKLELSKAASLAEEIPQADVNIEESSKPEIKTDNAQKDIGLRDINAANSQDSNKPEVVNKNETSSSAEEVSKPLTLESVVEQVTHLGDDIDSKENVSKNEDLTSSNMELIEVSEETEIKSEKAATDSDLEAEKRDEPVGYIETIENDKELLRQANADEILETGRSNEEDLVNPDKKLSVDNEISKSSQQDVLQTESVVSPIEEPVVLESSPPVPKVEDLEETLEQKTLHENQIQEVKNDEAINKTSFEDISAKEPESKNSSIEMGGGSTSNEEILPPVIPELSDDDKVTENEKIDDVTAAEEEIKIPEASDPSQIMEDQETTIDASPTEETEPSKAEDTLLNQTTIPVESEALQVEVNKEESPELLNNASISEREEALPTMGISKSASKSEEDELLTNAKEEEPSDSIVEKPLIERNDSKITIEQEVDEEKLSEDKEIAMANTEIPIEAESPAEGTIDSALTRSKGEDNSIEKSAVRPYKRDVPDGEEIPQGKDEKPVSLLDPNESQDAKNPESDLEKEESVEGIEASKVSNDQPDPPMEFEILQEATEGSTAIEDSCTASKEEDTTDLNNKKEASPSTNSEKNSSLLVSNQLIGTQNLPTNHIEIEKTTKKYSSGNVREIGTVSSGRLVPTPIAELQLKSFKTPNDDGAWYDIYVEPQSTSDKDIEINAATVEGGKPEMDQPKEVVEEPITVLERVPSYYTPKEMVQPEEPKPKNSISFYVSFDSDDDKPKYKIPKRFRNDPKKDSVKTKEIDVKNSNESEALTADSDADINDEDIEMIDVVEGDLEYQQVGSKLQTIIELNENEQPTEIGALQPDIGASADDVKEEGDKESNLESLLAIKTVTENSSDGGDKKPLSKNPRADINHYESTYKTDILKLTRSVEIIERAYRRFQNRKSQREINESPSKNIGNDESNSVVASSTRGKSIYDSDIIKYTKCVVIIERAYRRFKNRKSLTKNQSKEPKLDESLSKINGNKESVSIITKESQNLSENGSAEPLTKSNGKDDYESIYKTDITKLTRSVAIIERAYRKFQNRKSQGEINESTSRNIGNDESDAVVASSTSGKSIYDSDIIKYTKCVVIIERAYRRFKNRKSLTNNQSKEPKLNESSPEIIGNEESVLMIVKESQNISENGSANSLSKSIGKDDYESMYKTDILNLTRSVAIIERPYRRFKNLKSLKVNQSIEEDNEKQISAAKLIQNWVRNIIKKNRATVPNDIDEEKNKSLAAQKIQRAYRRYVLKSKEVDTAKEILGQEEAANEKNNERAALIIQKAFKQYSQRNNLKQNKLKADFKQNQAARKIQRAYRRYLNAAKNSEKVKESKTDEITVPVRSSELNSVPLQPFKDDLEGKVRAVLIIQRAFRQYMERKKQEYLEESSVASITSSRITAIENTNFPTEETPTDSLIQDASEISNEEASKISPKSEWFVGSTRIVPSQGVVEEPLELDTEPDPTAITRKTEPDTSTQVESVDTVDRSHGSLESKLNSGNIVERLGSSTEKDNALSYGLAGLQDKAKAEFGPIEDSVLLSQSEFAGVVMDAVSTQELVSNFLEREIEYSSAQNPFSNGNPLQEVVEEPCIKKSASLVNLSEGETEPEVSGKERTDSSLSETTGLDTLSADTIDKATMKLSKPEEMIEKMSQMRESKSQERIKSADPSFDEPVVRTMSLLQEQASLDIEDGDLIVYKRLQRDETRESSAQSDSVVFGDPETETENIQERDLGNEEESSRVHLMRHYTIAGDDPRGLFRSVTIDDALNYTEDLESGRGINSTSSFYLDDETSENIRKKMMAYSLSETDSDYFDPKKLSDEDFDIDTAMADAMGTSTETESTIVSAATKIQAGARGFLTRRRLRRASAGTKSSTQDTKASFGNDAISESLERFIEEEAAKKIQAAYRIHTRKRRGHNRKMEGISLESNLAARRQKLQRGDALRNDSTPDDENSVSTNGGQTQKTPKTQRSKTLGETKSRAAIELKWLTMRQNSMPVQIDCEVFRVIPKHMRKRIKSADSNKRK